MTNVNIVDNGFAESGSDEIFTIRREKMQGVETNVKSLQNFFTTFNKLTKAVEEVTKTHSQLTIAYNNYDAEKTSNESKSMEDMEKLENMEGCLDEALQLFDMGVKETYKKLSMLPDPRRTTRKIKKRMENVKEQLKQSGFMDDIVNHFMDFGKLPDNFEGSNILGAMEVIQKKNALQDCEDNATAQINDSSKAIATLNFYTEYLVEIEAGSMVGLTINPFATKYGFIHTIDSVTEGSPISKVVDSKLLINKEIITWNKTYVKNMDMTALCKLAGEFCAHGGTLLLGILHEPFEKEDSTVPCPVEESTKAVKHIIAQEQHDDLRNPASVHKEEAQIDVPVAGTNNLFSPDILSLESDHEYEEMLTKIEARKAEEDAANDITLTLRQEDSVPTKLDKEGTQEKVEDNQEHENNFEKKETTSDHSVTGTEYSSSSDSDSSDSDFEYEAIAAKIDARQAEAVAVTRQVQINTQKTPIANARKEHYSELFRFETGSVGPYFDKEDSSSDDDDSESDSDSDDSSTDDCTSESESELSTTNSENSLIVHEGQMSNPDDDSEDDETNVTSSEDASSDTSELFSDCDSKDTEDYHGRDTSEQRKYFEQLKEQLQLWGNISRERNSVSVTEEFNETLKVTEATDSPIENVSCQAIDVAVTETSAWAVPKVEHKIAAADCVEDGSMSLNKSRESIEANESTVNLATEHVTRDDIPVEPVTTAPNENVSVTEDAEVIKENNDVAKNTETNATEPGFTMVEMLIILAVIVNIIVFCLID